MVKSEQYIHRTPAWLKQISESHFELGIEKLARAVNGKWVAVLTIEVDVKMRDGRTVKGIKTVRVPCGQDGKRPNSAGFGKRRGSKGTK